ncbi:uncharacterized protein EV422DRAFT_532553 [Fimicolochytrium jonesii]|uniref:uncharacterized protein n=1 Tax=Fimicolochytrium jonesii TaxID=1396493 RepID=UPI0022FEFA43|nr:uncharacterized protein EV422DRAFT_532553 [Fimicolochytrium jonesii]KAI8819854.1 hypothetical protein EV422DRAFT_532553 [Fimicolochytrium jonesii]
MQKSPKSGIAAVRPTTPLALIKAMSATTVPAVAIAAVALVLLFRRFQKFRYIIRMIGLIIAGLLSSTAGIVASPVMYLLGKPSSCNWVVARTMRFLGPYFTGMNVVVEGKINQDNVPSVIVCNHQSSLDIICMAAVIPQNVVVMAKREIKYVPVLGWFMALANNVFIDRGNRTSAIETMAKVAVYLKAKKLSLWLFPEGTRSHQSDDSMLSFKKGAFHLAVQGNIPVIPIVCSTYHPYYDKKNWSFEPGVVHMKVLDPISTEGMKTADVDALIEKTRAKMLEALKSIKTLPPTSLAKQGKVE